MAWTSAVTGKRAFKHGVHGRLQTRPDGEGVCAALSSNRKTMAVWNILTQAGYPTNCVNWPVSHPAEPLAGVAVSERFSVLPGSVLEAWPIEPGTVHPAALEETLRELRVRPEELDPAAIAAFIPDWKTLDQENDSRVRECAVTLAETTTVHSAATWVVEHRPSDVMAVRYSTIERFVGRQSPEHAVNTAYALQDMMLGRLLQLADPAAVIIIVSESMAVMSGPGIVAGRLATKATLLDVTPTVLSLLGLPTGSDMDGRPWVASTLPLMGTWETTRVESNAPPEDDIEAASDAAVAHLLTMGYAEPGDDPVLAEIRRARDENERNLLRSLVDAGELGAATGVLETLVARHPLDLVLGKMLFETYLAIGRWDEARRFAEAAVARGGQAGALAHLGLGAIAATERRAGEATTHLRQAETIEAPTATFLILLAQAYLQNKNPADARRVLDRAIELGGNNAEASHALALAANAEGRHEAAVAHARASIEVLEASPGAHFQLGAALAKLGQPAEAACAFERCVELRPSTLVAYRNLEELYRDRLYDPVRAMHWWRRAREVLLERRALRKAHQPVATPQAVSAQLNTERSMQTVVPIRRLRTRR